MIKEINLEGDILTVVAEIPMRNWAKEKKRIVNTGKIIGLIKDKYEIVECLKESTICNWPRKSCGQKGEWKFKIFVEPKKQTRKPAPEKKESTGTKRSIRGRMSKIAKESKDTTDDRNKEN